MDWEEQQKEVVLRAAFLTALLAATVGTCMMLTSCDLPGIGLGVEIAPIVITHPPGAPATVTLTLYIHEDSVGGPPIQSARVQGNDAVGVLFDEYTNASGYVTITGEPGTWSFTASKGGYDSASWSLSITVSTTEHASLTKQVTAVTLTLYIHEDSVSGPPIQSAWVQGNDASGVLFDEYTNSSGYVTVTGTPGTWSFTASKSGYDSNSWSQSITSSTTEHTFLSKQVASSGHMYVTSLVNHKVVTADLSGSGPTSFSIAGCEAHGPVGIAVDPIAEKLYVSNWAESKLIMADLDGSNAQLLDFGGTLDGPNHIALDLAGGKMYVTNENSNSVTVANLDGSSAVVLTLGGTLNEPYGIAIDVPAGHMYVQNYSGPLVSVVRANLDGSSPIVMDLGGTLSNSRDICLDLVARRMYVVNTGTDSVTRANLDGTGATVLTLGGKLHLPYGLALDVPAGKMYVANYGSSNVVVADLDGGNVQVLAIGGLLDRPADIELGP